MVYHLAALTLEFGNCNQKVEINSTNLSVDGRSYCCPCSHCCHVGILKEEVNYSSIDNVKNQEYDS